MKKKGWWVGGGKITDEERLNKSIIMSNWGLGTK